MNMSKFNEMQKKLWKMTVTELDNLEIDCKERIERYKKETSESFLSEIARCTDKLYFIYFIRKNSLLKRHRR